VAKQQRQGAAAAFDIIVLCEHHLFTVTPSGCIRTQKRLGYHPMCCKAYPVADAQSSHPLCNLLVASAEGQLRVYPPPHLPAPQFCDTLRMYSDASVVWMARLPFVACSVLITQVPPPPPPPPTTITHAPPPPSQVQDLPGLLLALSDSGQVAVMCAPPPSPTLFL